jgi:hypothetical protein
MKLLLSLALLASAPVLSAAAPQETAPAQRAAEPAPPSIERQQLGRQFIAIAISPDDYVATMRDGITAGIAETAGSKAEVDETLKHFLALYEPKVRERLPNLMEAYAQVYAREFSADELKQMIAFAQTPAGRHYFSHRDHLDTDQAVLIQEEGFQEDALPILMQIQKEQCQARTAQRIAAGDKKARCPLADKQDSAAG